VRYSQLRAFHHVAIEGGFSAAAMALNQTQPSLSDQVRKLEVEHDVLLFNRDGRQVRMTPAGEELLKLTRQFFDAEDNIRVHLEKSRAAVEGELRIVADSARHITAAVGRFRVAHPKVFISIRTGNSEDVLKRLRAYEAEIGVVGNLVRAADLDVHDLGETPIIAIAARGLLPHGSDSIGFDELPRWPLIFREAGSRTRRNLLDEAERRGMHLTPAIEVDGREALREVVASGAGLGFVSAAEFGNDPRLVRVPIRDLDVGMTETIISLAARRDVPVIRAFHRLLAGD
jgi:aminoethylphosphonate catabolism LysR family transcriptional regulator